MENGIKHVRPELKKGLAKILSLLLVLELFVPGANVRAEEISFVQEQSAAKYAQPGEEFYTEITGTAPFEADEVTGMDGEETVSKETTPSEAEETDLSDGEDAVSSGMPEATPSEVREAAFTDAEEATPSEVFEVMSLQGAAAIKLYYGVAKSSTDAVLFFSNSDLTEETNFQDLIDEYLDSSSYSVTGAAGEVANNYEIDPSARPWIADASKFDNRPVKKAIIGEGTKLPAEYRLNVWFTNMKSLEYADLGHLDMNISLNVTMKHLFDGCTSLKTVKNLPVGGNVEDLSNMFSSCGSLTELDLSEFDVGEASIHFNSAFTSMTALRKLDISGDFKMNASTEYHVAGMFSATEKIVVLKKGAFQLGADCSLTKPETWYDEEDTKYTVSEFRTTERAGTYRTVFRDVTYHSNNTAAKDVTEQLTWENRGTDTVKSVTELSFTNPGRHFNGWNTEADGTGEFYPVGGLFRTTGEPYLDLYAIWSENDQPKQVVLMLDGDGGSTPTPATVTLNYGQSYYEAKTADLPVSVREHYHYDGWIDENGSAFTKNTPVVKDMTVCPDWEIDTHQITFRNWNGAELQSGNWAYGATPSYKGTVPTRAADVQYTYTFKGWDPAVTAVAGEAVYTATYSSVLKKYTATFHSRGGSAVASQTVDYGSKLTKPADPTKEPTVSTASAFAGWYKDEECKNAWDFDTDTVTEATELYAKWNEITREYTITFTNDTGKIKLDEKMWPYGSTPVYSKATPSKTSTKQYTYTFIGWRPTIETVTSEKTYSAVFSKTINRYTATFNSNGGSAVASQTVDYNGTLTKPADPTKDPVGSTGYTFAGWFKDTKFKTPWNFATDTVTKTTVLYAKWDVTAIQYKITFKNDDGTELQSGNWDLGSTPVYSKATPSKAPTSQYTYTFKGWEPAVTAVAGEAVYTATYSSVLRKYTATFNSRGGSAVASQTVDYGSKLTKPADPTKEPTESKVYTFAGWYREEECKNAWDFGSDTVTETTELYANWDEEDRKYTVTFRNWDEAELQSGDWAYGSTPVYSKATPSRAADVQYTYTFKGWEPAVTAVAGEAVYTATYSSALRKYTATFHSNGGTEVDAQTVDYGSKLTKPADPTKDLTGSKIYTFEGWYKDEECKNTWDFSTDTVTGPTELFANWDEADRKYTVTFRNWDEAELQSGDWAYGTTPAYSKATPSRASTSQYTYTFQGWEPAVTAVAGEAVYTATYSSALRKYTATFHSNGGTEVDAQTVDYGSKLTKPADPTKEPTVSTASAFAGWYKDEECKNAWDFGTDTVTEATELYAKWTETPRKYRITFLNEGGAVLQSGDWAYGTKPVYSKATPSKAATAQFSFTFDTWSPEVSEVTGEATYTATYHSTRNSYTVIFDSRAGSAVDSQTVDYGGKLAKPADPTRDETASAVYAFDGWYREISLINRWDFENDTVTGPTVLFAKWKVTPKANPAAPASEETDGGGNGSGSWSGSAGMGFSKFWYQDATGGWRIKDKAGKDIRSAWVCDDAVPANGKNAWYLMDANGYMVTSPLVRDRFGNLYCMNQEHRGLFGMMLFEDTNIGHVYVRFNRSHNGCFGAVIGEGIIQELLRIREVYQTDITDVVYTSTFL